jgi:hypothetical protein
MQVSVTYGGEGHKHRCQVGEEGQVLLAVGQGQPAGLGLWLMAQGSCCWGQSLLLHCAWEIWAPRGSSSQGGRAHLICFRKKNEFVSFAGK